MFVLIRSAFGRGVFVHSRTLAPTETKSIHHLHRQQNTVQHILSQMKIPNTKDCTKLVMCRVWNPRSWQKWHRFQVSPAFGFSKGWSNMLWVTVQSWCPSPCRPLLPSGWTASRWGSRSSSGARRRCWAWPRSPARARTWCRQRKRMTVRWRPAPPGPLVTV